MSGGTRRITDIRDRMTAQFNRLIDEVREQPEPLQERLHMFRQEGGPGPIRQVRRGTVRRRRMVTFKVSVIRTSSVDRVWSIRDATPSKPVTVPLDLETVEFHQRLQENFPELPPDFELCKVNGQRQVIPLQVFCPGDIRQTRALGRSCLYLRPKATQAGMQSATEESTSAAAHVQQPLSLSGASGIAMESGQSLLSTEDAASTSGASGIAMESGQSFPSSEDAASTREEFYLESSSSDEEEELLHSSDESIPDDPSTLQEILLDFRRSNVDMGATTVVIARRRKALQSACMALSKPYFSWAKVPQIKFVGEMGQDNGGPRREFFRLLMIDIQSRMGVLEGKPGELVFTYNQQALAQKKYYTAGKLTAWTLTHNGPGLRCFNKELYKLMCGQRPHLSNFEVDMFDDNELSLNLQKVKTCTTEAELAALKDDIGDWISSCGIPSVFSANLEDLPDVHNQIVAHFLFHRVANMIQQYIAGMNSCGRFWEMVNRNWKKFQPVFTFTAAKLTLGVLEELLKVDWSPVGSNNREREEETIYQWQWWLLEVQEGGTDFTFEDILIFLTGADCIPPLGFEEECSIQFYDQEPGERRLPYTSTCSQSLYLPRGVDDERDFQALIETALKGYVGFDKA